MEKLQMPTLVKQSLCFKLYIPNKVEEKIKVVCSKIHDIEWSGVLFVTHTGNFEDKNLVIRAEDFFIMDIGSSAYTEFKMSPEVSSYMLENDLLNCDIALIHSHHNMQAFFSGTDTATLQELGSSMNCFVSLIVNNAGVYDAAVTRRVKHKTSTKDCYSYEFFGDGIKENCDNKEEATEVIEYFQLNIEKECAELKGYDDVFQRIEDIKVIKEKKAAELRVKEASYPYINKYMSKSFADTTKLDKEQPRQYSLFEDEIPYNPYKATYPHSYSSLPSVKDLTLEPLVKILLLGSPFNSDSNQSLSTIAKNMKAKYDKTFLDEDDFKAFAGMLVEYVCSDLLFKDMPLNTKDETEYINEKIMGMYEELNNIPSNQYIEIYKDLILQYYA